MEMENEVRAFIDGAAFFVMVFTADTANQVHMQLQINLPTFIQGVLKKSFAMVFQMLLYVYEMVRLVLHVHIYYQPRHRL
jgi:hypothetical protein